MGNQATECCLQSRDRLDYEEAHNSINPIKYGATISNFERFNSKKNKANKNTSDSHSQERNIYTSNHRIQPSESSAPQYHVNFGDRTSSANSSVIKNQQNFQGGLTSEPSQDFLPLNQNQSMPYIEKSTLHNPAEKKMRQEEETAGHNILVRQSVESRSSERNREQHADSFERQPANKVQMSTYMSTSLLKYQPDPEGQLRYSPLIQELLHRESPFGDRLTELEEQKKIPVYRIASTGDLFKACGYLQEGRRQDLGILVKNSGSVLVARYKDNQIVDKVFFAFRNGSFYEGHMKNNEANDSEGQYHSRELSYKGGFANNEFGSKGQELGQQYYFIGQYQGGRKKSGVYKWGQKRSRKNFNMEGSGLRDSKLRDSNLSDSDANYQFQNIRSEISESELPPRRDFKLIPRYKWSYEGGFDTDQLFRGYGILEDPKGRYEGMFYQGKKNGKGIYKFKNTLRYEGDYLNDYKQGFGTLFNNDGTIAYQGDFKNDLPNGKGRLTDSTGKLREAEFVEGINSELIAKMAKITA